MRLKPSRIGIRTGTRSQNLCHSPDGIKPFRLRWFATIAIVRNFRFRFGLLDATFGAIGRIVGHFACLLLKFSFNFFDSRFDSLFNPYSSPLASGYLYESYFNETRPSLTSIPR